jgi:DNA invertase Pin-like site-specific DNA recombinase
MEIYEDVGSGAKASRPALNRLMADARARKFDCVLVWKLDRFGRSLVDCLNNIRDLEENGIRFLAVTQNLDTDVKNPASRFLLHVLGAAAEFERSLIRERTQAGQARYRQDFESGKVGKTVYSRSGRNMPPHRPQKVFDREEVCRLRRQGWSYRQIAKSLGLGLGTVVRTLQACSKSS